MFQRTGEVKALGTKKKIGEWECSGYELSDWITFQGGKVNEREVKMWVATERLYREDAGDRGLPDRQ